MEQNGSPKPVFETDDVFTNFLTVLPIHPDFLVATQEEETTKKVSLNLQFKSDKKRANAEKVLALMADNPKLTAIAIANELSLSERWIRTLLSQLSLLNIIKHTGSDKNGEWVIF